MAAAVNFRRKMRIQGAFCSECLMWFDLGVLPCAAIYLNCGTSTLLMPLAGLDLVLDGDYYEQPPEVVQTENGPLTVMLGVNA